MLQVALSHDIDRVQKTYQYLTRAFRFFRKMKFSAVFKEISTVNNSKSVYWNFEDIMETENRLGVRSTFFFLNESIRFQLFKPNNWQLSLGRYDINDAKIADVIQKLDTHNWEIGLHGSYLSFDNCDLLVKEKKNLEDILGHEVIGIRQHYLNWNDRTWAHQHAAGFKYDSSLGFTNRIGYYHGIASPFRHGTGYLVEFPLAIMDICYLQVQDREEVLKTVIEQTEQSQGVLVLNWHGDNWDEREFPNYKNVYIDLIKHLKDSGAVFKSLGDYYKDYDKTDMPSMIIRK